MKNTSRVLYTNKLSAQTTKIRIKLKLSHTLSTTDVQLVSKRGGLFFPWRLFSLGGGGGKHPTVRGGGVTGGGGGSCEEFGVDKGGGGVDGVRNQGVWGRGVHGLVMMVHKSLMSDV